MIIAHARRRANKHPPQPARLRQHRRTGIEALAGALMLAGKHCRFHIAQTLEQLAQLVNGLPSPSEPSPLRLDPEPTAVPDPQRLSDYNPPSSRVQHERFLVERLSMNPWQAQQAMAHCSPLTLLLQTTTRH